MKKLGRIKDQNFGNCIGYAWVFENIVVYGNPMELGKRVKSQLGEFLGVIKAVIPYDPHKVLYERLKHTKSWLKRHPQRTLNIFRSGGERAKMKFLKWCWKQMRWYIIFLIVPDVAFGMYYWYKSERRKNSSEVKEQK